MEMLQFFLKKVLKYCKTSPDTFLRIFCRTTLRGVLSLSKGQIQAEGYLRWYINENWAGVEEGGSVKTQPQPILDPSNGIIRLELSLCSINYK